MRDDKNRKPYRKPRESRPSWNMPVVGQTGKFKDVMFNDIVEGEVIHVQKIYDERERSAPLTSVHITVRTSLGQRMLQVFEAGPPQQNRRY